MKTIKKISSIIISAMILILTVSSVLPSAMADSTLEKTTISVTNSKYKYISNTAYPDEYNPCHLATIQSGTYKGEPAYCIEYGKDMGETGISESVQTIKDLPAWSNMSQTQQRGITYATIYGYPNYIYDSNAEASRVATQFIIWEYAVGSRTGTGDDPKDNLGGGYMWYNGAKHNPDVWSAYCKIIEQINNHKKGPNFAGTEIELAWSSSNNRYEKVLTDSNNQVSNYNFTSSNSNIKLTKSGNKLTVYSATAINSAVKISMSKIGSCDGVNVGLLPNNTGVNQSLVCRLSDPVNYSFSVKTNDGSCKIIKTSEDGKVSGIKFNVKGGSINQDVTTKADGTIQIDNLVPGEYTVTEYTDNKYANPKAQTVTVTAGKTATVSFSNVLKKFTVTLTKKDSEKSAPQGDGTLAGAVYGIYNDGELVDKYTTDEKGQIITKEYICGDNWTVKEISASEGYLVDTTVHKVGAESKNYTVEHNVISLNVIEDSIKGKIEIIKHTDNGETQIETPEKGAEFQVYLKSAGSFDKAKDTERDLLVCDEYGYAKTKNFPYGIYTVHQTKGWDGREFISDFDVYISSNNQVCRYLINNANFESYIKVVKKDKETNKVIPYAGAGFKIYSPDGKAVTMKFTYPTPTTIDTFYTDSNGSLITPETLPYGKGYKLVEVQAPYGYVLDSTPVFFDVTKENSSDENGITIVKVEKTNTAQKGIINITKSGEIFSSVISASEMYQPKYEMSSLADAVYEITAAEDIYTSDGTIRAKAGDVVDTVTTDSNGKAVSKKLYLGKYTIREIKAPYGMVLNTELRCVELSFAGQSVSLTETSVSFINDRQKVSISLLKVLKKDETFGLGMNDEINNVSFGLYAKEDIIAKDGSFIPANGLIEIVRCEENGNVNFNTDLPYGSYYVKEYATDKSYVLDKTEYPVIFEYAGQQTTVVSIDIGNGQPIINEPVYGKVIGLKIDRETEKNIAGAVFGLFSADETEFTEDTAILLSETDKDGIFRFNNIPYGNWFIRELKPADGYLNNTDNYVVTVSENEQIIEFTAVNDKIPEIKTTATVNGEKEFYATETVTLKDTITFKHLIVGKEYLFKGVVMDKSTKKPLIINGEQVTAETKYTPETPDGEAIVEFVFDATIIKKDTSLVVFETLYKDGIELTTHADLEDEGQTVVVKVPKIGTTATIGGEKNVISSGFVTIEDKVEFHNLTPGKECTLKGKLMNKSTGKPLLIDGKEVLAETKFTPDKSDGTVTVLFSFNTAGFTTSTEVVVFETLYRNGIELATHTDINDDSQTVIITPPDKPDEPNEQVDTGETPFSPIVFGIIVAALSTMISVVTLRIKSNKQKKESD